MRCVRDIVGTDTLILSFFILLQALTGPQDNSMTRGRCWVLGTPRGLSLGFVSQD